MFHLSKTSPSYVPPGHPGCHAPSPVLGIISSPTQWTQASCLQALLKSPSAMGRISRMVGYIPKNSKPSSGK